MRTHLAKLLDAIGLRLMKLAAYAFARSVDLESSMPAPRPKVDAIMAAIGRYQPCSTARTVANILAVSDASIPVAAFVVPRSACADPNHSRAIVFKVASPEQIHV